MRARPPAAVAYGRAPAPGMAPKTEARPAVAVAFGYAPGPSFRPPECRVYPPAAAAHGIAPASRGVASGEQGTRVPRAGGSVRGRPRGCGRMTTWS